MSAFSDENFLKSATEALKAVRPHLEAVEAISHAALLPAGFLRVAEESSMMQQMVKVMEQGELARRLTIAPMMENLQHLRAFEVDPDWFQEMERTRQMVANLEAQFRLPDMTEITRLTKIIEALPSQNTLAIYAEQQRSLQTAIEEMRTPWLNSQEALRSLTAFRELQGIGHALKTMPAFGENLTAALRTDLGDWRDRITFPPEMFKDFTVRSDFYASLGFDPALTEFPPPAFEQSIDIAGMRREPPPLIEHYGDPVPRSGDNEQEEGFVRTNLAHDWLQRLETQLRAFIDKRMTQAFGTSWPRHRLPNGLYDEWQEKKRKALKTGAKEWPLISYADFADYERVICKADNWKEIFAHFFGRPETVRESFQRLYPIRLDTMHARPITQDDELLLYVETRRLVKVILLVH